MRPLYECIKEEKSKADKMFEKLGYEKTKFASYKNANNKNVVFDDVFEEVVLTSSILTKEELQAINEKVKELGWNE